ncbi:MAG TPA: hypothetical protein VMV77_02260 [Bacteroidales bacterium]|nr:hypothetical protein [Bacteroidales bacterium]
MFKSIKVFIDGIKFVLKYGSLITVILGILVFASEKLEEWQKENEPKDKG